MDLQLHDKTVLVTASSKGLGKATALEFAREGATVILSSRNEASLLQTANEIKEITGNQNIYFKTCDMSSSEDISHLFNWIQADNRNVDILINNTGGPTAGGFKDVTDEDWIDSFEKNLLSYVRTTRAVLPHMQAKSFGRIVNISSSSTKEVIDNLILSNTFRLGMVGLTKTLAREYAKYNILVNTVGPGRISTDRVAELDQISADRQNISIDDVIKRSAQRRDGWAAIQPDEFANVGGFIGTQSNTYMTGQSLVIDGGMLKAL